MSENKVTIEGANASMIVNDVALKKGLEMPIIKMTYRVVHENYNPVDAIKEFMSRNPSKERNYFKLSTTKYFNNAIPTIDAVSDLKIVFPKLITSLSLLLKNSISSSENPPTGPIYTETDL